MNHEKKYKNSLVVLIEWKNNEILPITNIWGVTDLSLSKGKTSVNEENIQKNFEEDETIF